MSKVTIRGIKSTRLRNLIRAAAYNILGELLTPRMNVFVEIHFKPLDDNFGGFSEWTDDPVKPREFLVEIDDSASLFEKLTYLAHELVHVKQHATGQFYQYQRQNSIKWGRDKYFIEDFGEMNSHAAYMNYPWEKEAYQLEGILRDKFLFTEGVDLTDYE